MLEHTEASARKRVSTGLQVLAILLLVLSVALWRELKAAAPLTVDLVRAYLITGFGIAAAVLIWRGERAGATLFLIWSVLVATRAVYPLPRLGEVWPAADVIGVVLVLVILLVLNRGVRRELLPAKRG